MVTLCFLACRAILDAKAGINFSAASESARPISIKSDEAVPRIFQITGAYGYQIQLLAASSGNSFYMLGAALAGAMVVPVPVPLVELMADQKQVWIQTSSRAVIF